MFNFISKQVRLHWNKIIKITHFKASVKPKSAYKGAISSLQFWILTNSNDIFT